ncbi:hypothetical protein FDX06_01530 [Citrobacter sp. wls618]|nr:hypothetical protein FDW99_18965 [Citrobacter sp. wls758]TKV08592.1 hypothetical protein FDX06_01530 [Citrobacter sp. wls618]
MFSFHSLKTYVFPSRDSRIAFMAIQIMSFVFYFPIIYGARYYTDDLARANLGYYGWESLGRYFASGVAYLYSLCNDAIIDPMPFGYFINIFIIGCSAYLIFLKSDKLNSSVSLPVSLLFIVNPFLVQNLLYRFDSLGMVLAMFFVVSAFSIKNDIRFAAFKVLLLLVSLNFYQTFSNLYIGLVAVQLLLSVSVFTKKTDSLKFAFANAVIFVIANAIYFIELKTLGVSSRGEILQFNSSIFYFAANNIITSFSPYIYFWSFSKPFIIIIIPFIFISIITLLLKREFNKLFNILFAGLLIVFSSIGFMAILKEQFVDPRGLSYFPVTLIASFIVMSIGCKRFKWFIFAPVFACFIFVSRVGNMHLIQNDFEKPIAYDVTKDIYKLSKDGVIKFYSRGSIPLSNFLVNSISSTPFNGFIHLGGWVATGKLQEYDNKNIIFEWSEEISKNEFNANSDGMKLSVDNNPFYKIYTNGNTGWIIWKNS